MQIKTYGYGALGGWDDQADNSAGVIVPLILELVKPQSVVDVGCGPGRWLQAFQQQGVKDILGMDGAWVPLDKLHVPRENFQVTDLTKPLSTPRRFDLVVSLEVAEHLVAESAETFVDSLASLGDVILFSAAIPDQRGFQHVNEQFQDYWAEKFRKRGFEGYDYIRPKTWALPQVSFYYSQNILLYVKKGNALEAKLKERQILPAGLLSVVHPELYFRRAHPVKHIIRRLKGLLKK